MLFSASALCLLAALLLHQFPWLDGSVRAAVTASLADLTSGGTRRAASTAVPDPATAPVRLRVPAIGVDAEVLPLGLDAGGAIEVPGFEDAMKVGWYTLGARPGSSGATVLVGHRDAPAAPPRPGYRDAVFARLDRLVPGDRVETWSEGGRTVRFRVTAVDTYPTESFPTRKVYGPVRDSQLRLITCGGALGRDGHWDSNLVISAVRETRTDAAPE
ncbi:sortase domain-containing protein [Streptomyces boluensis]|uniref:Sortase n=1 Tax=Streptomyces boluensis TaxID=1775135 RepID=A0A964URE9_9ACTN|nr:sortase [Streptomyces boluensis]NBE50355.1 sortase [Streptomyces boluensis]